METIKEHYDKNGFNRKGIHKDTGTRYGTDGYDRFWYDSDRFDRRGLNRQGYRKLTPVDSDGYDIYGYDEWGYDREGYHYDGYNEEGNYW